MKKAVLPLTFVLGMFSSNVMAAEFSGYANEVFTGPSASATFNMALIGMSSTDGGAIERYIFTSDSDYVNMIVNARANHESISIANDSGIVGGVYYR